LAARLLERIQGEIKMATEAQRHSARAPVASLAEKGNLDGPVGDRVSRNPVSGRADGCDPTRGTRQPDDSRVDPSAGRDSGSERRQGEAISQAGCSDSYGKDSSDRTAV
jgi:hypothetical protein